MLLCPHDSFEAAAVWSLRLSLCVDGLYAYIHIAVIDNEYICAERLPIEPT